MSSDAANSGATQPPEPPEPPSSRASESSPPPQSTCPLCGAPIQNPDRCGDCDWVRGYRHRDTVDRFQPRDIIAAALSVVPGAGHIYKGHDKAGIGFFLGLIVLIVLLIALGIEAAGFQLLLLPLYWLWVMIQAYLIEDRRSKERPAID